MTTRKRIVAIVNFLGPTLIAVNAGIFGLDSLSIAGLTFWALASAHSVYCKFKPEMDSSLPVYADEADKRFSQKNSTHLMINAVLQASAATAYLTSDLLNPDRKAIDGIRIAGSASWLANSICCFWKGANEHKENVDDKKTNACTASNPAYDCINEAINTTGAFLYLTHTCLLWSRGKPRPLKLAANACWVVGAIHDVIEASRLQHDETKPDSLPANKTEICTLARLEVSVAQNIA